MSDSPPLQRDRLRRWLPLVAAALLISRAAHAQDATDQRRCIGEWRITVEERVASCTALIDSGHYQGVNLAILHDNRGIALRATGDLAAALKDFTEDISLDPNSVRALVNRGSALWAQRDFDGAIADFDQAIKLDPTDASTFMKCGSAYDAKGIFDRAVENSDEALRLVRHNTSALLRRR